MKAQAVGNRPGLLQGDAGVLAIGVILVTEADHWEESTGMALGDGKRGEKGPPHPVSGFYLFRGQGEGLAWELYMAA